VNTLRFWSGKWQRVARESGVGADADGDGEGDADPDTAD
jgi:hypothetical protein